MEDKPEVVRTYNSVWKVEKVLYGIQDIALPIPVSYRQVGFFGLGVLIVWLLNQFPPFSILHLGLIEYLFLPGVFSWYFTKQKLDGKAPHRFIVGAIRFYFSAHKRNRYQEVADQKQTKPYRYAGDISYRVVRWERRARDGD